MQQYVTVTAYLPASAGSRINLQEVTGGIASTLAARGLWSEPVCTIKTERHTLWSMSGAGGTKYVFEHRLLVTGPELSLVAVAREQTAYWRWSVPGWESAVLVSVTLGQVVSPPSHESLPERLT